MELALLNSNGLIVKCRYYDCNDTTRQIYSQCFKHTILMDVDVLTSNGLFIKSY